MILHLSLGQHNDALELYRASIDATGLPRSPLTLEIAVEASLRLHKSREEAEAIMSAAQEAGMNVTCAMGPLIIDQIDFNDLRSSYEPEYLNQGFRLAKGR